MNSRALIVVGTLALVAFIGASCASVNQKLNKENRARFEAAPKDMEHAMEGPYLRRAWAPGQWATYAIRSKKIWTVQKISIVAEDAQGYWVEIEIHDPNSDKSPTWMKLQISGYDPGNPESIRGMKVGEMYMLDEAGGQVSSAAMPFGMANPWETIVESMKISLEDGPAEDIAVVAGRFPQSKRIDSKIELYGFTSEGTAWFHSAIPIWGYALQVTTDGKYESKLLEFGYEGAESVVDHTNAVNPFGS